MRHGVAEVVLLGFLYVGYTASRMLASNDMVPAQARAGHVLHIEKSLGIAWEATLNRWFSIDHSLAVFGSFWYATTHYIVTAGVLVWLFGRGFRHYRPARRALVIATILALLAYLTLPTAPPRLFGHYVDVLQLTSGDGWWGGDASAPKGLGGMTNQLAAFPSLHAGWAFWVAVVLQRYGRWRGIRITGWLYAMTTALVIVGTANHWVLDVITGWAVVLIGFAAVRWWPAEPVPDGPSPDRSSSTSAADSTAGSRRT